MDKFLYYPVKPIHVNQPFGANYNAFYNQAGMKGHNGIDFMAAHGQAIYAAHDGTCYPVVDDHGGNGVVLMHPQGDETIYWHLIQDDAVVKTRQVVKVGDLLGYADSTGQSTGDHLHFGYAPANPDRNNGYIGYVDPQPYFNGLYAQDINNPPTPTPPFQFTLRLALGSWNMEVKKLQEKLGGLVLDGVFGPKTEAAVKAYQTQNGLVADGIVGPLTRAVLNK